MIAKSFTLQLTWFVRTLRKINLNAVSSRIERQMFEDLKVVLQRPLQSLGIVHCRKVVVPDKSGSCSRRGCVTCHQWLLSGAERWKVFLSNSEKCPFVTLVRLNILNEWVDNLQAGCFWPTANGVCFRGGLCQGHVVQTSRAVDDWPKKRQQSNGSLFKIKPRSGSKAPVLETRRDSWIVECPDCINCLQSTFTRARARAKNWDSNTSS